MVIVALHRSGHWEKNRNNKDFELATQDPIHSHLISATLSPHCKECYEDSLRVH